MPVFTLAVPLADRAAAAALAAVVDPDTGGGKSFDGAQTTDGFAIWQMYCENSVLQELIALLSDPQLLREKLVDRFEKDFKELAVPDDATISSRKGSWMLEQMTAPEFCAKRGKKLVLIDFDETTKKIVAKDSTGKTLLPVPLLEPVLLVSK